ncbi:hypothetical protein M1M86_02620 [Dehalococcoidales bacterium]|nr:hypothetical protein [Dehalococcoidales bacterium]
MELSGLLTPKTLEDFARRYPNPDAANKGNETLAAKGSMKIFLPIVAVVALTAMVVMAGEVIPQTG